MATYSISGPDGKTYTIEGPEGATREQVIDAIRAREPSFQKNSQEVQTETDTVESVPLSEDPTYDENNMWAIALRNTLSAIPGVNPDIIRRPDFDPKKSEGVAQEAFEGVGSGLTKIVQGVAETATLAPDLVFGTSYGKKVAQAGDDFRHITGLDPVGVTGSLTDIGTQFVFPAGLAIKAVTVPGKAIGIYNKTKKIAKGILAAGAADAVVSTEGIKTIGDLLPDDWYGGSITNTEDDIGLEGRQDAWRRLKNKVKVGSEGGIAQVIVPPAISTLGQLISKGAVKSKIPYGIGKGVQKVKEGPVGQYVKKLEDDRRMGAEQKLFTKALVDTMGFLRYRGILPDEIASKRSLVGGVIESETRAAQLLTEKMDARLAMLVKKGEEDFVNRTPNSQKAMLNDIEAYILTPDKAASDTILSNLPKSLHGDLRIMRSQLSQLSKEVSEGDFIKQYGSVLPEGSELTLKETIEANMGEYLRRQYRIYSDRSYQPSEQTFKIAKNGFAKDPKAVQEELDLLATESKILGTKFDPLDLQVGSVPTAKQVNLATESFFKRHQRRPTIKNVGRIPVDKLDMGLFQVRKDIPEYKRALLGEIKNPLERYVSTVADLSQFKAVDDYFGSIRQLATDGRNPGIAKLFRDTSEMSAQEKKVLTDNGYIILGKGTDDLDAAGAKASDDASLKDDAAFLGDLGAPPGATATESTLTSGWGTLDGFAVPQQVYNALTRTVYEQSGDFSSILRGMYSGFLKAKGATQYGKTILSPATQVRNVTTASMFALANGNVGKGANLLESIRSVFGNLGRLAPEEQAKAYKRLQELGVVGSQAQLKELQALLAKGLDLEAPTKNTVRFGSDPNESVVNAFGRKISKPVKSKLKLAENLYQAGDDIWKTYSFDFEKRKLINALADLSPKQQATYLNNSLKNVMDLRNFDALNLGQQKTVVTDLLEQEAASIVRNTVPNYNMSPAAIKALRRAPIGSFVAFPYEIMRTSVNILGRGLDEMASSNPKIQEIGLRRITGLAASIKIVPDGLVRMGRHNTGVTEEEEDAYRRSLSAPWDKNAQLLPVGRNEKGQPEFVNLSYSMPYDMIQKIINGALNSVETDRLNNKSTEEVIANAFSESAKELYSPFLSESIALGALRDVLPTEGGPFDIVGGRGGKTLTGAEVYDSQDSRGDKWAKSIAHLVDAIAPNIIPVQEKSGKFVPSRFAQGFINSLGLTEQPIKDRMGRERDLTEELSRIFSGVGTLDSDMYGKNYQYKGYEIAKNKASSATIFNSVARRPNVTREQLLEAYKKMTAARRRNMNEFYVLSQDAETLGFSKAQQKRLLKEAGVSGFDEALQGRFKPLDINPGTIKIMKQNGTIKFLPRSDIKRIQRKEKRIRLGPQNPPVENNDQSSIGGRETIDTSSLNLAPPVSNVPIAQPNLQVSQASSVPLSPSLVGDFRNMDIANRLGRA